MYIHKQYDIPYLSVKVYLVYLCTYEFVYRKAKVLTQLPFELKLQMPPTDRGGRGYSDEYIANIRSMDTIAGPTP